MVNRNDPIINLGDNSNRDQDSGSIHNPSGGSGSNQAPGDTMNRPVGARQSGMFNMSALESSLPAIS